LETHQKRENENFGEKMNSHLKLIKKKNSKRGFLIWPGSISLNLDIRNQKKKKFRTTPRLFGRIKKDASVRRVRISKKSQPLQVSKVAIMLKECKRGKKCFGRRTFDEERTFGNSKMFSVNSVGEDPTPLEKKGEVPCTRRGRTSLLVGKKSE